MWRLMRRQVVAVFRGVEASEAAAEGDGAAGWGRVSLEHRRLLHGGYLKLEPGSPRNIESLQTDHVPPAHTTVNMRREKGKHAAGGGGGGGGRRMKGDASTGCTGTRREGRGRAGRMKHTVTLNSDFNRIFISNN